MSAVLRTCAVLLLLCATAVQAKKPKETEFEKAMRTRLEELHKKAKEGDASSENRLGSLYLTGNAILKPDPVRAVYWFSRSAEQGFAMGQFNLGLCYDQGIGVENADTYQALKWYRKAADQGLFQAQINAAYTLKEISQYTEAFKYFRMASRSGDVGALREVGIAYLDGLGVEQDFTQAAAFLKRAAEAGDIRANLKLADVFSGEMYPVDPNPDMMFNCLWRAASSENADVLYANAEAMAKVAFCFDRGIGTPVNVTMAERWYRKAADLSYPQAMVNLGDFYASGRTGPVNPAEAFSWYNKAANANFPAGLHNVGVCYYQGFGTDKNLTAAVEYFSRAAKAGYARSQFNLGHCYEFGEGVPENLTLAYYWYKQGAQQEDAASLIALAWCYLDGRGVSAVDKGRAKACLIRARAAGSEEADRLIRELF